MSRSIFKRYGYLWVTLVLFLGSLAGHWAFAWQAFVTEQRAHGQPGEVQGFLIVVSCDTWEIWQSEFLQLIWQVAGLAFLFYAGSPQSKEGDDRKEEKLDLILKAVDQDADQRIRELDRKYARE